MIHVRQNVTVEAWEPKWWLRRIEDLDPVERERNLEAILAAPASFGRRLWRVRASNLIPDAGLNYFRDLAAGGVSRIDEIAVGTGTTAAAAADVALQTEVFRGAITRRVQESKKVTLQLLILQSEANGFTLSEVGLFKATTLVARAILSPTIAKTSAIMVTIAHELSFANG